MKEKKNNVERRRHIIIGAIAAAVVAAAVVIILAVNLTSHTEPEEIFALSGFEEGTTINGFDVSELDAEDTAAFFSELIQEYELTLTVGDFNYSASARDLSMELDSEVDFNELLEEQLEDPEKTSFEVDDLFTYSLSALEEELDQAADDDEAGEPKNASIAFDEESDSFVVIPSEAGTCLDPESILDEVSQAVAALVYVVELDEEDYQIQPEITEDSPEIITAMEEADAYKDLVLTYVFTPDAGAGGSTTIDWDLIRDWLYVDEEGLVICIDSSLLNSYVNTLADRYSVSSNTSAQFKTTGGDYIAVNSSVAGQTVNADALYDDIYECLSTQTGGTRNAPYDAATTGESGIVDYGGNYVEIDLTNQYMYCYNNGELVVSGPVVSGCIANGNITPTGVYTIKSKQTNRYLNGADYSQWVYYWMPFNGDIGLHDGWWRDTFGGTEYYYNGSHGCVNLEPDVAPIVYANVSVGTHVIVYGGLTSIELLEQTITTSKDSYTLNVGDTVDMKVTTNSEVKPSSYTSSNTSVCTVSKSGVITAKGAGTATITIEASATPAYNATSKTVEVTVKGSSSGSSSGSDSNSGSAHKHSYTSKVTTAATCTKDGVRTYTCSCGDTYTEKIAATGHKYDSGKVTKSATCTATGTKTYTCTVCGGTKTETIAIDKNNHTKITTTTTAATCGTPGSAVTKCSGCGAPISTETIPATGNHTWDGGTITKEATATEDGELTYKCTVCGETKTEVIPATSEEETDESSGN